jgi:prepilin-type N-terminal cleavage/methylation domain-containing protein
MRKLTMRDAPNPQGFTILELVLALGILSIGLLFLSALLLTVIRTNNYSYLNTVALQLAQEKIETLKTTPYAELEAQVESGLRIGSLQTVFQRETSVQKGSAVPLADILVKVSWPAPAAIRRFHSVELFTRLAG